eukprot:gene51620-63113_t
MGVLPLQFPAGESWMSLGLDGTEIVSISGVEELNEGRTPKTLHVVAAPSNHSPAGKATIEFDAVLRIDTPGEADYYRNGGILQFVLSVNGPRDLDRLSENQLTELAAEIRRFLVTEVAKTGGHLGPNLGVVELTLAIHRVFDSPRDSIIFDTGHQSYVHKILTGRKDFSRLRLKGGLAGYPQRSESVHDIVESSHASSSLSWADGISRAFTMTGQTGRYVIAVVGDGSLTGGMTWEALNNITDDNSRKLIIIVNDNGRSYAPTIGGMAHFLNRV